MKALRIGAKQFWNVLPFFVAVFGLIGLLEVLLTPKVVQAWLGSRSGLLAPELKASLLHSCPR